MCQVMKSLKYEITYIIVITKEKRVIGFIFVDDIDLVARKLFCTIYDIDEVFDNIQRAIDT